MLLYASRMVVGIPRTRAPHPSPSTLTWFSQSRHQPRPSSPHICRGQPTRHAPTRPSHDTRIPVIAILRAHTSALRPLIAAHRCSSLFIAAHRCSCVMAADANRIGVTVFRPSSSSRLFGPMPRSLHLLLSPADCSTWTTAIRPSNAAPS